MITCSVSDGVERLYRQFGLQSKLNGSLVPLQNGEPYTPPNLAEIQVAAALWKPFSLHASPNPCAVGQTVTISVNTSPDVASVDLLIGDMPATVQTPGGTGIQDVVFNVATLPPHRVVRAVNQAVFGYRQIVLVAE